MHSHFSFDSAHNSFLEMYHPPLSHLAFLQQDFRAPHSFSLLLPGQPLLSIFSVIIWVLEDPGPEPSPVPHSLCLPCGVHTALEVPDVAILMVILSAPEVPSLTLFLGSSASRASQCITLAP